ELLLASEEAQKRGRPRILPVRLGYTGPLPDPIAAILDPLMYALWEDPKDNQRLVAELVNAIQNPASTRSTLPHAKLEPVGGAVPLDSKFYIQRAADEEFRSAVTRQDSIVLVKGARQMGKTS